MKFASKKLNPPRSAIGNRQQKPLKVALWAACGSALLSLAAAPAAAAPDITSMYTSLAPADCKLQSRAEENTGATFACPGLESFNVTLSEGDLRMFISYGRQPEKRCVARQTFAPFNTVGEKLEWRIKNQVPIATIVRYSMDDTLGATFSFLAVTALTSQQACHMAYIDGDMPDHNEIARIIADTQAEKFQCDKHIPLFVTRQPFTLHRLVTGAPCPGEAAVKYNAEQ